MGVVWHWARSCVDKRTLSGDVAFVPIDFSRASSRASIRSVAASAAGSPNAAIPASVDAELEVTVAAGGSV